MNPALLATPPFHPKITPIIVPKDLSLALVVHPGFYAPKLDSTSAALPRKASSEPHGGAGRDSHSTASFPTRYTKLGSVDTPFLGVSVSGTAPTESPFVMTPAKRWSPEKKIRVLRLFTPERKAVIRKALSYLPKLYGSTGGAYPMERSQWIELTLIRGQHSKPLKWEFENWAETPDAMLSFKSHLLAKHKTASLKKLLREVYKPKDLHYLWTEAKRSPYEVCFIKDRVYQGKNLYLTKATVPHLFVLSTEHKLYIHPEIGSDWSHSTFLAGGPVFTAGEVFIDASGRISEINNKSGHYRLPPESLLSLAAHLKESGVDLFPITVTLFINPSTSQEERALLLKTFADAGFDESCILLRERYPKPKSFEKGLYLLTGKPA